MRDIAKEAITQEDIVHDKFTILFERGSKECVVKLIENENGNYVTSNGDRYVPRYFFTMFFARRYFKKLRDRYPEEVGK